MRFHYIAARPDGRMQEGNFEAKGVPDVLSFLASQGLRPVSVKPIVGVVGGTRLFRQKITLTDKVFLVRYLSLMLKIGTDLFKAIDILIADFDKQILKDFLGEIRSTLEKGQPFYSTFAKYPQYFSSVFVNMVRAGEASGTLEQVFDDLGGTLEREKDLRSRIKAALIYPALLLVLAAFVLLFLVTFALPKIAAVFEGGGFEPPFFSRIVFGAGLFLGDNALLVFGTLFIAAVGGGYFFAFTETGKKFLIEILAKTPVVKVVARKIALQRFSATLSSLMRSGLPILEALEITANAVDRPDMKAALLRVSREGVTKGMTLGEAFKKETAFPAMVTNLVAISEKAGHLDEILRSLANFYEAEIETSLKMLVSFVEPLMLLIIGAVVGLIALSIIMPIYQLVGQF